MYAPVLTPPTLLDWWIGVSFSLNLHCYYPRAILSFSDTSPHQLLPRACTLGVLKLQDLWYPPQAWPRSQLLIKKIPAGLATSFTMSLCVRFLVIEQGILNTGRLTREDGGCTGWCTICWGGGYATVEATRQTSARSHSSQADVKGQLRRWSAWRK